VRGRVLVNHHHHHHHRGHGYHDGNHRDHDKNADNNDYDANVNRYHHHHNDDNDGDNIHCHNDTSIHHRCRRHLLHHPDGSAKNHGGRLEQAGHGHGKRRRDIKRMCGWGGWVGFAAPFASPRPRLVRGFSACGAASKPKLDRHSHTTLRPFTGKHTIKCWA